MTFRQFLGENFAGDLEYHPHRAAIYLVLGAACALFWYFSPSTTKFTTAPLMFALGSLALLIKGIFLVRKSSEGLGLTESDLAARSNPANRKPLPPLPAQIAQVLQDFAVGPLLLWPVLNLAKEINSSWTDPPLVPIFFAGAILFLCGWAIRRLTSPQRQ